MSRVYYLRVLEDLKVELQTGVSCHEGAGNDPNTLEEQAKVPSCYYLHSKEISFPRHKVWLLVPAFNTNTQGAKGWWSSSQYSPH